MDSRAEQGWIPVSSIGGFRGRPHWIHVAVESWPVLLELTTGEFRCCAEWFTIGGRVNADRVEMQGVAVRELSSAGSPAGGAAMGTAHGARCARRR